MQGEVDCSTIESRYHLNAGDSIVLEPCVFHSSHAISEEGVFLMEVETPPLKGDLLRCRDSFGRAGKAYENANQYSIDLSSYDYTPLNSISHGGNPFPFKSLQLQFSTLQSAEDIKNELMPSGLAIPLLGRLVFGRKVVADIGEAVLTSDIPLEYCPPSIPPVELLQIAPISYK